MTEDQVTGEIQPKTALLERQATLFPVKPKPPRPTQTDVWLKVEDLPGTEGIDPTPQFIENVRHNGIFFTIVLRETKRGLSLVDGRRRLEAARRLGLEEVRCDIYPVSAKVGAIITLVANFQRSNNPPSELHAIEQLLKRKGVNPQLIAEQLGVPIQTIEKRLKLKALVPELRAAFDTYKIAVSVAEAAARLETARQLELVPILEENGRLTMKDVNAQLEVRSKEATDALPSDMFPEPKPEPTTDMIKVERCVLEDTAETLAYASEMFQQIHKGGGATAASVKGVGEMVKKLEELARAYRVLADE